MILWITLLLPGPVLIPSRDARRFKAQIDASKFVIDQREVASREPRMRHYARGCRIAMRRVFNYGE